MKDHDLEKNSLFYVREYGIYHLCFPVAFLVSALHLLIFDGLETDLMELQYMSRLMYELCLAALCVRARAAVCAREYCARASMCVSEQNVST